jgi:error-prone DNA polymerase
MIGIKGVVQKEGQVIHVVTEEVRDYTDLLRSVGDIDFRHRTGPGDGVAHPGSPDRGEREWERRMRQIASGGGSRQEVLNQKTRDFH